MRHFFKIITIIIILPSWAYAATTTPATTPPVIPGEAQKVDMEAIKKSYWNDPSFTPNVVQNREYSKAGRVKIEGNYGLMVHDPFLSTTYAGVSLGYNINEYIGINALYWRIWDRNSPATGALTAAEADADRANYAVNVNPLQWLAGGELSFGLLYGKLSLIGKAIIHFDLMFLAGAGYLASQNLKTAAPWFGISQQIYLFRFLAIKLDYRCMIYRQVLVEDNDVPSKGSSIPGPSPIFSQNFSVGLVFLLF
jgi:outer membrane beta-barrel protein